MTAPKKSKGPGRWCRGCARKTWSMTGWCAECRKRSEDSALVGGRWAINLKTRVLNWVPDHQEAS